MRTYVEEYGIGPCEVFEFNHAAADSMIKGDRLAGLRVSLQDAGNPELAPVPP